MSERDNLTAEELAELNKANCLAMDLVRAKAKEEDQIPPCWLVMSAEAKNEAIENLCEFLSRELGRKVDRLSLSLSLSHSVPDEMLHQWQEAEATFKRLREEGNPRAYFAG